MTPEAPFAGDIFLEAEIRSLVQRYKCQSICETGTYIGLTTKAFASMVPVVHTVEVSERYFRIASQTLKDVPGVTMHKGRSQDILPRIIPGLPKPRLYFLDAHWQSDNPLIQEIEAIAAADPRPILVIHDMKNPDHPEFGFDSYNGQDYEFAWIETALKKIRWTCYYNQKASGDKRGVLFVVPEAC